METIRNRLLGICLSLAVMGYGHVSFSGNWGFDPDGNSSRPYEEASCIIEWPEFQSCSDNAPAYSVIVSDSCVNGKLYERVAPANCTEGLYQGIEPPPYPPNRITTDIIDCSVYCVAEGYSQGSCVEWPSGECGEPAGYCECSNPPM